MTAANVNDFIISTVEEVFLFINYTTPRYEQCTYVRISLPEKFPTILLRKKISDAMPGVNVMNCNFLWHNVVIAEDDLIPLIKAKAGCGQFQINLKDKLDLTKRVLSLDIDTEADIESLSSPVPKPDVEKVVILEDTTTDSASESSHGTQQAITTSKFAEYVNAHQSTKRLLHSDHTEPSVRKAIISTACDFLFQECGEYASVSDRNHMVTAVVEVFRGLELQEQFVTKWLHMKIKNNHRKAKLSDESADSTSTSKSKKRRTHSRDSSEDHFLFLKSCQGNVDDIPRIKAALKTTIKARLDQYGKDDFSVFDTYNFFTKSPDLIYYEFEIRFPNATEDVPLNLELFLDAAHNIFRAETRLPTPEQDCMPCVQKLLCICHFTKTPKSPMKPTTTLSEMLENMVLFLTEDQDQKPEFKPHPILLAQGPTRSLIDKYFLQIEDVLVELPTGINFLQAFDYLMRSYYVFNISFPKILLVFFNFIMLNVYDVHVKSKWDPKKQKIEDTLSRPREFLRKVMKCINDMK